jgi:hypothetical protein
MTFSKTPYNKNYMSIGVLVRTTKFAARNNGIGVRQESNPQSATTYISVRYASLRETNKIWNGYEYK